MYNLPLKRFEELEHTLDLLALDWFGGISPNLDEPDNPLIECVFSPVREIINSEADQPLLLSTKDRQIRAGIAVGYLPSLFLGKLYRNGKAELGDRSLSREEIEFEFDTGNTALLKETTLFDLYSDLKEMPINSRYVETVARSGIKILTGKIKHSDNMRVEDAISNVESHQLSLKVIIHEMEMIRYYMTNSEHSCKLVMTGAFQDDNFYTQVINRKFEEPGYYPELGGHRFVYRHGYREDDAPVLGRILFEPEKLALLAAQRISKTITCDTINSVNSGLGYPRTNFPFSAITKLKLAGRRIKINTSWYFQVHRILDCTGPYPFQHLSYSDEIAKGGNPAPLDAPVAFAGLDSNDTGPVHSKDSTEIGHSRNDHRPSATAKSVKTVLGLRTYSGLATVTLVQEKLRDSTYQSQSRRAKYVDTLVDTSTGKGTSGSSSAAKQQLEEKIVRPSPLTRSLQAFISAINALKISQLNWQINSIGVGVTIREQDEIFSLFPEVSCEKHDKYRQFSYMDKKRELSRRLVCFEIVIDDKYLYIWEAQRRRKDIASADDEFNHKEALPILLLHNPGYEYHAGKDFLNMLEKTVIEKNWPQATSLAPFIRGDMHHCKADDSLNIYTGRLEKFILAHLPVITLSLHTANDLTSEGHNPD